MKLSNKYTLSRLLFAPVFFCIYNLPLWFNSDLMAKVTGIIMIPLLAFFEFTDFLDGYYARKNGEVSDFGKLFDPFADVMLNLSVFISVMTSYNENMKSYMPVLIFVLILYREFGQSFFRMLATKHGVAIAARKGGKIKTCFYITSGFFALTVESVLRLGFNIDFLFPIVRIVSICLFGICLILSYVSFIDYIKNFSQVLKSEDI